MLFPLNAVCAPFACAVTNQQYAAQVKEVTPASFGLLMAYLIPGFIVLWGLEPHVYAARLWLGQSTENAPTIGGFLYATIAAVALGQLTSTVRWLLIDPVHHHTGIAKPAWNFSRLPQTIAAFDRLIEDHFRYYQFHANGLVAVITAAILHWTANGFRVSQCLLLIVVVSLLYIGSRDTLAKYYRRVEEILHHAPSESS